jgi:hypothetical protein
MESFNDYKMVTNKSVVEQAHEILRLAKKLELLKCVLPDEFVAGCIIAKLPSSWRNFATSLKHKRQKISVENLIASLDVEEKARVKDNIEKGNEEKASAPSSRETMARTRENLSNLLSMLNKILPSRRRRKTKQSYRVSHVESLVILLKIVRSERTRKIKRKSTS